MTISALISIDMEGISGIVDTDQTNRYRGQDYQHMRNIMTLEGNAAIEGCFEGGADRVLIADSHGSFRNLLPDLIDSRAELITGAPRPLCMMEGVDQNVDIALCIGYHNRPGEPGVLSHTIRGSSVIQNIFINNIPASEFDLNLGIAGQYNVPIGLISGDTDIIREAKKSIPNIIGVSVKEAISTHSAISLSPQNACELIKKSSKECLENYSIFKPKIYENVKLSVEFSNDLMADLACYIPEIQRENRKTISYESDDFVSAFKLIYATILLAGTLTN